MNQFIEVLFNTKHEMPSGWVIVVLLILAIVVPNLMRWVQSIQESRRQSEINASLLTAEQPKKKTKNSSKKKKKK